MKRDLHDKKLRFFVIKEEVCESWKEYFKELIGMVVSWNDKVRC